MSDQRQRCRSGELRADSRFISHTARRAPAGTPTLPKHANFAGWNSERSRTRANGMA